MPATALSVEEIEALLACEFPQAFHPGSGLSIERVGETCLVRHRYNDRMIRPGGTISGPTMMALADFAMYVAVLAAVGPVPLAVTINLNINFLARPKPLDLIAEARILRLSRRQAVCEVQLYSQGEEGELVAHVTGTYALPVSR